MPYIGKKPENIIATAVDSTTGDFSGVVTANAGIKVDNITIDGSEIDLSGTGDFNVDVGGDIIIDSDGADILLKHDGTHWGSIFTNATPNNLYIQSMISDGDIYLSGNDGGSNINALQLDMSDAGTATFNHDVIVADGGFYKFGNGNTRIFGDTSSNLMSFVTSGTERMRIDSSGNVHVATTSTNQANVGISLNANGNITATRDGGQVALFNRKSDDGVISSFRKDGTEVGTILAKSSTLCIGSGESFLRFNYGSGQAIIPVNSAGALKDNAIDLGEGSARFDDIFASNGTIQTSDRNEKQDIEELTDAEKRVAVVAKGLMRKFRWKDKVAQKGDNARTHFGIIAQDLQDAFTAESLDASKYAMFCSDTWWEKEISVDAVKANEKNGIEAKDAYTYTDTKQEATTGYTEKTRLGVRYSELLAFIISAI